MQFEQLTTSHIPTLASFYVDYYNNREGGSWTVEQATVRISQMVTIQNGFGLVAIDDNKVVGFVMGFLRQYDDLVSYYLDEIVVASIYQNRGIGSAILQELFLRLQQMGVAGVELISINDEQHKHFYGKAGFKDATNHVNKVKWF